MLTAQAIQCPTCKDIIYSRAVHDFRYCSCHECFIDGGFDYTKIGWTDNVPEYALVILLTTKKALYDDWNKSVNMFGKIPHLTTKRNKCEPDRQNRKMANT